MAVSRVIMLSLAVLSSGIHMQLRLSYLQDHQFHDSLAAIE
jgi:hypothetical protein